MSFFKKIELQRPSDFKRLEQFLALTLISIPAILWIVEGKIKCSISSYVRMENNYVFGSLLTIAAMLYIFTGVLYYKDDDNKFKGQEYNVVLGLLLLGVVFVPCDRFKFWHFVCAIGFFVGNALLISIKSSPRHRGANIIFSVLILLPYAVYFALTHECPDKGFTLFWAEWISLTIIAIHFFLESLGIFSFTRRT